MRNLLVIMLLASSSGCAIHEPSYQIIYTPDKTLTNGPAGAAMPLPMQQTASIMGLRGVEQQASR